MEKRSIPIVAMDLELEPDITMCYIASESDIDDFYETLTPLEEAAKSINDKYGIELFRIRSLEINKYPAFDVTVRKKDSGICDACYERIMKEWYSQAGRPDHIRQYINSVGPQKWVQAPINPELLENIE